MPAFGAAEHLAGRDGHRREQIDGAVAPVVTRHRPPTTGLDRQAQLRPIQRLALGLLIEREHHRPLRRIEIQPDDIDELRLEVLVVRQLERVDLPRPQIPRLPYPHHRVLANTVACAERASRPTRRSIVRNGVQRVMHDRFHRCRLDLRLAPTTRCDHPDTDTPTSMNRSRHAATVFGYVRSNIAVERTERPSANSNNAVASTTSQSGNRDDRGHPLQRNPSLQQHLHDLNHPDQTRLDYFSDTPLSAELLNAFRKEGAARRRLDTLPTRILARCEVIASWPPCHRTGCVAFARASQAVA